MNVADEVIRSELVVDVGEGSVLAWVNLGYVIVVATGMAAVGTLGTLPVLIIQSVGTGWSAFASAVAAGLMIASSFLLSYESQLYSRSLLLLGLVLGLLGSKFASQHHTHYSESSPTSLSSIDESSSCKSSWWCSVSSVFDLRVIFFV
jgi:hypothetical protein